MGQVLSQILQFVDVFLAASAICSNVSVSIALSPIQHFFLCLGNFPVGRRSNHSRHPADHRTLFLSQPWHRQTAVRLPSHPRQWQCHPPEYRGERTVLPAIRWWPAKHARCQDLRDLGFGHIVGCPCHQLGHITGFALFILVIRQGDVGALDGLRQRILGLRCLLRRLRGFGQRLASELQFPRGIAGCISQLLRGLSGGIRPLPPCRELRPRCWPTPDPAR